MDRNGCIGCVILYVSLRRLGIKVISIRDYCKNLLGFVKGGNGKEFLENLAIIALWCKNLTTLLIINIKKKLFYFINLKIINKFLY